MQHGFFAIKKHLIDIHVRIGFSNKLYILNLFQAKNILEIINFSMPCFCQVLYKGCLAVKNGNSHLFKCTYAKAFIKRCKITYAHRGTFASVKHYYFEDEKFFQAKALDSGGSRDAHMQLSFCWETKVLFLASHPFPGIMHSRMYQEEQKYKHSRCNQ